MFARHLMCRVLGALLLVAFALPSIAAAQTGDLAIDKTDGAAAAVPGNGIVYTITVSNPGPDDVTGATVDDTFPATLTGVSWSCVASGGSTCTAAGAGDIADSVDLLAGGSAVYTVTATISAAATGTLDNTATLTPPGGFTDPDLSNNTSTDSDTLTPEVDLSIDKTDGSATAVPGNGITYTITVTNTGPSDATGASVNDTFPVTLSGVTWTCAASIGSSCTAAGAGNIADSVDVLVGGTLTYTVNATISASATGMLANTATVSPAGGTTDTNATNDSSTDTDTLAPQVDLSINKTDGSATAVPGNPITYTITVTNTGPSDAIAGTVNDTFPVTLSGVSWTCAASLGSSCTAAGAGNIADSVDVLVGGTLTYTVNATISASATGMLANTATVSPAGGTTDTNATNDSSTDTDTLTPQVDLSINKTDGSATAVPGNPITYTITVTNTGPSDAIAGTVNDTFPVTLSGVSWTCAASLGSSCTAAGAGNIADSVDVLVGGTLTYTVNATISASATGMLANTATVSPAGGTTDTNVTNNSSTDTDTLTPQVDLSINKTDGSATAVPGNPITYTITVTNTGPSDATGASVNDTFPVTLSGVTWTCAASIGSSCTAAGAGNIADSVDVLVGGTLTYTVNATISASATGMLANTATVTAAGGTTDTNLANNSSTDTDILTPQVDLSINKTDGSATAVPGNGITYTITVTNTGPSVATAAAVNDTFPATLSSVTWTCAASIGSSCTAAGAGNIADTVDVLVGGTLTYTVNATISASATGMLANTATVTAAGGTTDTNLANNSSTDTDTLTPQVDLSINKTDGSATEVPGTGITYTITITNTGPSVATGASVTDTFPGVLTGAAWTCVASGGSSCMAAGAGNISDSVNVLVGGTLTYTVNATISAGATGTLSNTAIVTAAGGTTDTNLANNSSTDSDMLTPQVDLSINKTDGSATEIPGTGITYTITVTNTGPSVATGASVTDTFPGVLTGATWTCVASGGSSCTAAGAGNVADAVNVLVGGTLTYTVNATIVASATGILSNTASVTAPGGVTDTNGANNSSTDNDTLTPQVDLSISKTDGVLTEVPGTSITYNLVVANSGPSDAPGTMVADTLPPALSSASWTCVASPGSTCTAAGAGSIVDTVLLLSGGTLTYTLNATIAPGATGTLSNTATVTAGAGITETNPGNNSSTDNDTLTPQTDLSIVKTDGVVVEIPGTSITYSITVSNAGPSNAVGASVVDTFPAALTGATWTCVASGGSVCPGAGAGSIAHAVNILVGGVLTYTVNATIDPAATGSLSNTATAMPGAGATDPVAGDNTSTDTDSLTPTADLSINKTDGVGSLVAGTMTTYTITVTNLGPSDAASSLVTDTFPVALLAVTWTCSASVGSSCTAAGAGNINDTVNILAGGTLTYTATGTLDSCAPSSLSNTATVAVAGGVIDPNLANNSSTDTDTITVSADLQLTIAGAANGVLVCNNLTYTITVTNNGPSCASSVSLTNVLPGGVTFFSSTPGGPTCTDFSGTQICNLGNLAVSASTTVTVSGTIDFVLKGALIADTATVTSGTSDPNGTNNTAVATTNVKPKDPYIVTVTGAPRFLRIGGVTKANFLIRVTSQCEPTVAPTDVVLTSTLPSGLQFTQSTPDPDTQEDNVQTYELPGFFGGTTEQIVMEAALEAGVEPGTELTHTVSVLDDLGQKGSGSFTMGVRAPGPSANKLKLTISAPRRIQAGGLLKTRLSIDNTSLDPATGVELVVTSPVDAQFASAVPPPTSVLTIDDQLELTWSFSSVPHKQIIKLNQRVSADVAQDDVLTLDGTVTDEADRSGSATRDVVIRGTARSLAPPP